jgi:hypothetical protein
MRAVTRQFPNLTTTTIRIQSNNLLAPDESGIRALHSPSFASDLDEPNAIPALAAGFLAYLTNLDKARGLGAPVVVNRWRRDF